MTEDGRSRRDIKFADTVTQRQKCGSLVSISIPDKSTLHSHKGLAWVHLANG